MKPSVATSSSRLVVAVAPAGALTVAPMGASPVANASRGGPAAGAAVPTPGVAALPAPLPTAEPLPTAAPLPTAVPLPAAGGDDLLEHAARTLARRSDAIAMRMADTIRQVGRRGRLTRRPGRASIDR